MRVFFGGVNVNHVKGRVFDVGFNAYHVSQRTSFLLRFALLVQFAGPSEKKTWFSAYCGREQGQQMSCLKENLEWRGGESAPYLLCT